jgi:hypothetical protein
MLVFEECARLMLKRDPLSSRYTYLDQLFSYLARNTFSSTVRLLNLSPELVDYIRDREYLSDQVCAGIRDQCISGFLAALLMKDSNGVYV